ncbi:MAG: Maf-like protein [Gammaproteobacteria bacterium]|nr:Maf-like protein [Gammaproteobacteria bacterium]
MTEKDFDLYLASTSPRRCELLAQIGVSFHQIGSDIDETPGINEMAENFVVRMAVEKAQAGQGNTGLRKEKPILGADTAVVIDNEILGKPSDREQAISMLNRLSGRSHQVMSAVALIDGEVRTKINISTVSFRTLSQEEIEAYWQTGEPKDKAGAYGIQGKAAIFINRLEGSYSAVMGLPLFETAELLHTAGIRLLR